MKSNKELRKFGITMAVAFGIIAGILWWRDKDAWQTLAAISGFFLIFGLVLPRALFPIEWAWMKLAHVLGTVMTIVLVTITYYLVITPIGVMMRLFGKDVMNLKFDPSTKSYWTPVEVNGPNSRPDKPF